MPSAVEPTATDGRLRFYNLEGDDHRVVPSTTCAHIRVRQETLSNDQIDGEFFVSTVFLGMDHSFSDPSAPPLVFETYISGPQCPQVGGFEQLWDVMERYSTWDQAIAGHEMWRGQVESAITDLIATGYRSWPPPPVVVPKVIIQEITINPEYSSIL